MADYGGEHHAENDQFRAIAETYNPGYPILDSREDDENMGISIGSVGGKSISEGHGS